MVTYGRNTQSIHERMDSSEKDAGSVSMGIKELPSRDWAHDSPTRAHQSVLHIVKGIKSPEARKYGHRYFRHKGKVDRGYDDRE